MNESKALGKFPYHMVAPEVSGSHFTCITYHRYHRPLRKTFFDKGNCVLHCLAMFTNRCHMHFFPLVL